MGNQIWELEIPTGTYNVLVAVGDPEHSDCHTLAIEGIPIISNCTDVVQRTSTEEEATDWKLSSRPFLVSQLTSVSVLDGRLTLFNYGQEATKLLFLEVYPCTGTVLEALVHVLPNEQTHDHQKRHKRQRNSPFFTAEEFSSALSRFTTDPDERFHVLEVSKKSANTQRVTFLVKDSGAYSYKTSSVAVANRIAAASSLAWTTITDLRIQSVKRVDNFHYDSIAAVTASGKMSSFTIVSIVAGVVTGIIAIVLIGFGVTWYRNYIRGVREEEEYNLEALRASSSVTHSTDNLLDLPPVTRSESELAPPVPIPIPETGELPGIDDLERGTGSREELREIPAERIGGAKWTERPDTPAPPPASSVPTNLPYTEFVDIPLAEPGSGIPRKGSDPKIVTPTPRIAVQPPTPPTPTRNLLHLLMKRQNSAPSALTASSINTTTLVEPLSNAAAPSSSSTSTSKKPAAIAHGISTPTLRGHFLEVPSPLTGRRKRSSIVEGPTSKQIGM